jgi:hypothetical protein
LTGHEKEPGDETLSHHLDLFPLAPMKAYFVIALSTPGANCAPVHLVLAWLNCSSPTCFESYSKGCG